ncbi:hypothetical protein PAXINDRAFT_120116 [Paxillus involutus ATCC 200175]|uniref:Uncharacterized protein n=1 Tax=Paxillus involutus ATCC 200175 TaxID=664439 RepID=A0A0C9SZY1_PAXIN|nr:hypothetical protein PAXINDRAFT_120116 [Paxillus involutus ATCC 200175]
MLSLLLVFSLLVHLAKAASTNATCEPPPPPDPTSSNYRSIWSILGTCALTLLICIWNATYPNITFGERWYKVALYRVALGVIALVTPEVTVMRAYLEWKYADDDQWSRTHGFFKLMGGFIHKKDEKHEIMNHWSPVPPLEITKEEISDKSKTDGLGNTLLVLQLSWFIVQVIARGANHLAITLVEVDTLALAALSFPLFFFWWSKPMAVNCPHIVHSQTSGSRFVNRNLPKTHHVFSTSRTKEQWLREITVGGAMGSDVTTSCSVLSTVWIIFGGLHLIAWDFQFPSQAEKIIWRIASFTLIAAACTFLFVRVLEERDIYCCIAAPPILQLGMGPILNVVIFIGVVARFILLALMLASLRDLPPSAYETVSWTTYIPHL